MPVSAIALGCGADVRTQSPSPIVSAGPPEVVLPDPPVQSAPTARRTSDGKLTFYSFVGGYAGDADRAPWGARQVDLSLRQTKVARLEFWPADPLIKIRIETGTWEFAPGLITIRIDQIDGAPGTQLYRFRTSADGLTLEGGRRTPGAVEFDFRLTRVR